MTTHAPRSCLASSQDIWTWFSYCSYRWTTYIQAYIARKSWRTIAFGYLSPLTPSSQLTFQISRCGQVLLIKFLQPSNGVICEPNCLEHFSTVSYLETPINSVISSTHFSLKTFASWLNIFPSIGMCSSHTHATSSNVMIISSTGRWKLLVFSCHLSHKAVSMVRPTFRNFVESSGNKPEALTGS